MFDLTTLMSFVPLTQKSILVTLVDALLAAVVIIIVNKLLAHEFEIKHALMLSVVALFITPVASALALSFIGPPVWITLYILPLLVWVILGEVLLSSDVVTKLKVIVVAFFAHVILSLYLAPELIRMLPL